MKPATELLVEGEYILGQYQVAIARRKLAEWTVTIPPVNVLTTQYRLILWPQTLKPYPPASIPCTYILEASLKEMDHRYGIKLWLKTEHRIYMIVSARQEEQLLADIKQMVRPPRGNPVFSSRLARRHLTRLIKFLEAV